MMPAELSHLLRRCRHRHGGCCVVTVIVLQPLRALEAGGAVDVVALGPEGFPVKIAVDQRAVVVSKVADVAVGVVLEPPVCNRDALGVSETDSATDRESNTILHLGWFGWSCRKPGPRWG